MVLPNDNANKHKFRLQRDTVKGYIYLLPVLIVLVFLNFYPFGYTLYTSFLSFSLAPGHFLNPPFVGFKMYDYVFTLFHFKTVFINTVIFSVGSVALMVPIGFALALVMNQRGIRGKRAFRTAILFPWAFPAFITILIWAGMLDPHFGIIDELFRLIGLKSYNWLTNPSLAMLSAILVNLWLSFPYYTFVYTATIQSIPSELNEAAEMDGYGLFGRLRRVILPLVSRQIAFITIFGFIFTWNNFYVIYLLTGGGPGISTSTLMVYSYVQAFSDGNYSIAAAYSIISLLILLVFVVIANKYTKMMQVIY